MNATRNFCEILDEIEDIGNDEKAFLVSAYKNFKDRLKHSPSPFGLVFAHTWAQWGELMETRKEKIVWSFRKARFPGGKRLSIRWLLAQWHSLKEFLRVCIKFKSP